jgi:protein SCO1/2
MGMAAVVTLLLTASTFMPVGHAAGGANSHWGANYFPNIALTTHDGKTVHFYDDLVKGKTVAIDLIYTHCKDSCPLETARLAQVQKMLGDRVGKDIFFYSISIDPKQDTPEVLRAYAEKFHAGPGWLFLTGKKEDIELLSKKLGLYTEPDPSNRDGHTPSLLIGNEPTGQWMRNSALDNPRFLAVMIGDFLDSWTKRSAPAGKSYAEVRPLNITDKGQYLFATRCAACHTIGHGDKIGPDLLGVTNVRDRAWLTRFINMPDTVLAEGDPIAQALYKKYNEVQMPNVHMTGPDVDSVVDYLDTQTAGHHEPMTADGTSTAIKAEAGSGKR